MKCATTGKVSYASRGKAEASLRSLKEKDEDGRGDENRRGDPNITIYPCASCLGFHLGHLKKNAHRNKYPSLVGN